MMLLIFWSSEVSGLVFTVTFMDRIDRATVRNGRTYQANIVPGQDGKLEVSVISVDDGERVISELQAVIAPEDFELFGKVFTPDFAAAFRRRETEMITTRPSDELRKSHPNHGGVWTAEMKKNALDLHRSGKSIEEIGVIMGRTVNGIRAPLRRMGVEMPYG